MPPTTKRSTAKDGAARDIELANANATCARALGGSRKTWMKGTGWSSNPSHHDKPRGPHSHSTRGPVSTHTPTNHSNSNPSARTSSTRDLVRDSPYFCSTPNHTTQICPTRHNTASRSYESWNADPISINCRTLRQCPNHRHSRMFYPRLLQVKNIAMRPSALSILKMGMRQYRTAGRYLWRTRLQEYV